MKEYKILSVKECELEMCLETIRAAFGEKVRLFGYTPENYPGCAAYMTLDELRAAKAAKVHMYAAWVSGRIAGYVQLEKKEAGIYSFQRFSVLPEYQNLGIGRALISHCRRRAASYGAKKLTLLMRYENRVLFEFYKSCGFILKELGRDSSHPFEFAIMEADIQKSDAPSHKYKYKNYLFDLDGTLTDPGEGIKNSIIHALNAHGLPPLSDDTLNNFIGPPLVDSFIKYCGVSRDAANELLSSYREYFSVTGIFENKLLEGAESMLSTLREGGCGIFLATSKPQPFAERILEHFGLLEYFDFVGGSGLDGARHTKEQVISYVMRSCDLRAGESLMVGDRCYDIDGAHLLGLDAAGVLVGYGDRDELGKAEYILERLEDIPNIK